jgi:hypothetical protein
VSVDADFKSLTRLATVKTVRIYQSTFFDAHRRLGVVQYWVAVQIWSMRGKDMESIVRLYVEVPSLESVLLPLGENFFVV